MRLRRVVQPSALCLQETHSPFHSRDHRDHQDFEQNLAETAEEEGVSNADDLQ